MATKLNRVMTTLPEGAPVTSARLRELEITPQLAQSYVHNGWLKPLGRGVYQRMGDALALHPSLRALETMAAGLHVGGKTALDWQGVRHYVPRRPVLQLYGQQRFRVPAWFAERFPAEYHVKRLFAEPADAPMGVDRFGDAQDGPLVSDPERALLEVLSEVGVRQSLEEARQLAEGTHTLRESVLVPLLKSCASIKTVRLALTLGRELDLPWAKGLRKEALPTGSASRWVARSKNGLLVLDP